VKRTMVEGDHPRLSAAAQCWLLSIQRSSYHHRPVGEGASASLCPPPDGARSGWAILVEAGRRTGIGAALGHAGSAEAPDGFAALPGGTRRPDLDCDISAVPASRRPSTTRRSRCAGRPLRLLTGRACDLAHNMTRTSLTPRLAII
jgi:hypothetical protein